MKIAFTYAAPDTRDLSLPALRGPLEEAFRLLGTTGYDGVELVVRDPVSLGGRQIRLLAAGHELAIAGISTSPMHFEDQLSLCHLDPSVRAKSVDRMRDAVDLAAATGALLSIGAVRGQLSQDRRETALEAARESVQLLLGAARASNVVLAIEPLSRTVCNWINTVAEAIAWIEQFDPRPKILFDVYQASLEEASVHAALIRAQPHLCGVRMSDSNRLAPGMGHYPFAETIRILAALGFAGYLSVECRQYPDSVVAARQAAVYLAPLLSEVGS